MNPTDGKDSALPEWVQQAAQLPVGFAQVREDSRLDLAILQLLGRPHNRIMMIASGGCTAAALASSDRTGRLHLVDANAAQLALTRLKLKLLEQGDSTKSLAILGHAPMPIGQRRDTLKGYLAELDLDDEVFGPLNFVAERGPDYCGRYELLFAQLAREMRDAGVDWESILTAADVSEKAAQLDPSTPTGRLIDGIFDRVMQLPNLIALFGIEATRNSLQPFCRHFAERTRWAAAKLPTADNPFLWQVLLNRFPPGHTYTWFERKSVRMPEVEIYHGKMESALADEDSAFDLVHLSNILDWLDVDQARHTLELAANRLRVGGCVFIRQLNSSLDIPALTDYFEWLPQPAETWHARDRSFFYRRLHVGMKR